jgi:hypothetical protein
MLLDLIEQSPHCLHHICELGASEGSRDQHRYDTWKDLQANFFDPQRTRHLFIYFEEKHADLWIVLCCADLFKTLKNFVFQSLLIN